MTDLGNQPGEKLRERADLFGVGVEHPTEGDFCWLERVPGMPWPMVFCNVPDFSSRSIAGIGVGAFLTALLTFLLTAAVIYFAVVTPYNKFSDLRKKDEPAAAASAEDLLGEIRDLLREQAGKGPNTL